MGREARVRPARLAGKLMRIRHDLNLSQSGLVQALGFDERYWVQNVSAYELGKREPPLMVLLGYARLAGVYVETLIDDRLDLPPRSPGPTRPIRTRSKATRR